MKNTTAILLTTGIVLPGLISCNEQADKEKPNIIIIYADDLGYGDLGCYGASAVKTPNLDRMAMNGLLLTDAHCSAATSTPSRYSLLTGSYAFRKGAAVLPGDAPLIIDTSSLTLASMFKASGYRTGVIGKWHLGLGSGKIDWNGEIKPGPSEVGFEYSYIIPATGDRVPCVFVENGRVAGLNPDDPIRVSYREKTGNDPTGSEFPGLLKMNADPEHSNTIVDSISRIGFMSGGMSARWKDEEFPLILASKAKKFILEHKEEKFFLYLAFHDIHVPRIPNQRFRGTSSMGPRGDAIAQADWVTGEVIRQLEVLGLASNTLILFSSDNGPVLNDGYQDQAVELLGDHKPSGPFRGGKYSAFEAGTRVPSIVYWPGTVQEGRSDALLSQVDLLASFASLVQYDLKEGDAPDSFDFMDSWLGKSGKGREYLLEQSVTMSLRRKNMKFIKAAGQSPEWLDYKKVEGGIMEVDQLYDLSKDPSEQNNIAEQYPEVTKALNQKLEEILNNPGRK